MAVVALVGYREQRSERNWMRSSSNPRRKGCREKTETFIFPLFVPFSHFRVRSRFLNFQWLGPRALAGICEHNVRVEETHIGNTYWSIRHALERDKLNNIIFYIRSLIFNLSDFCLRIRIVILLSFNLI